LRELGERLHQGLQEVGVLGSRGGVGVGVGDVSSRAGSSYLQYCGGEGLGEASMGRYEGGTGAADREGDKFPPPT